MTSIKRNISISMLAQVISMACGFLLQLLIPKFIDVQQYAYWQTFVLYANYVGILHFGLLDGFVLRYSQYDYEQLDKIKLRTQFFILLVCLNFFALILSGCGLFFFENENKELVFLIAVSILIKNVFTYASYSFQITNRIRNYAVQVILHRVVYLLGAVALILGKVNDFFWFCFIEMFGEFFAICYAFSRNPDLYIGKLTTVKNVLMELKLNVLAGLMLMVANWTGNFMIALMRLVVQNKWGMLAFGQVSFSFSVMQIFLAFIMAASIALFPSIKRMRSDVLPGLYKKMRDYSSFLLLCAMQLYFPVAYILKLWLPKYETSLSFLAILLPVIVYSAKLTMLTNTYLKVYRKEKMMMLINVSCLLMALILFVFSAYLIQSMNFILYSTLLVMAIRSIISEYVVEKIVNQRVVFLKIEELLISIAFVVIAQNLCLFDGFAVYAALAVAYCVYKRNLVMQMLYGGLKKMD